MTEECCADQTADAIIKVIQFVQHSRAWVLVGVIVLALICWKPPWRKKD